MVSYGLLRVFNRTTETDGWHYQEGGGMNDWYKDGGQLSNRDSKAPETLILWIMVSYSYYFQIDE